MDCEVCMRERAIFLILASALLLGVFALASPPAEDGPVTLAVATDLHYISPRLTDGGEAFLSVVENADGKAMPRIDELVRAFAAEIAVSGPDALIITGDLSFNGARLSHEDLAEILAGIEEAGVPVYVIPGNHDLDSSQAARFEGDTVTLVESVGAAEFREIYRDFGFDEALSEDSASLSYTARIAPGLRLLCVDVNGSRTPGWVSDETLEWAEAQLAEARSAGERVLAVSHQNLYMHNPMFLSGYVISNSAQLEELYLEYGVLANLSGHIHLQHTRAGRLPELVTSSLAVSPNQYGLLTVDADGCSYETESVEAGGDFAAWSAEFFRETAINQALEQLGDAPEAARLAEFYAEVNALYFAGRCDLIAWDEELLAAWTERAFFIPMYFESIRDAAPEDYTRLEWSHE